MKRQIKQHRKDLEMKAVGITTASMIRRGAIIDNSVQIAKETEVDMTIKVTPKKVKSVIK